jgi:hypothetical protein
MTDTARPIPMIDDLALDYVTHARQRTVQRSWSLPIPGLAGDVQQVAGRASYEIEIAGVLVGEDAADKLASLQEKAKAGTEVTFTADITAALELDPVVIVAAEFEEGAGTPGYYDYRLLIRESPPLPPPAELAPLGGLDGFDLGFDTDILGDIADMAGDLQNAIDQVTGALDALQALAGLGDLGLNNPVAPMMDEAGRIGGSAGGAADAAAGLSDLLGGGS